MIEYVDGIDYVRYVVLECSIISCIVESVSTFSVVLIKEDADEGIMIVIARI